MNKPKPVIGKRKSAFKRWIWPIVGLTAVAVSLWLLFREIRGISLEEVGDSLAAISVKDWILSITGAFVAYGALAGYDALALRHLGRRINWFFITVTSFTTYALSHNIGASVLSGSVVRYRAYSSRGLSTFEIAQLIAFCSFTFAFGTFVLTGLVLLIQPQIGTRFIEGLSLDAARWAGAAIMLLVAAYVYGSWRGFRPLKVGPVTVHYPQLKTVMLQLIIGPLELLGAAAIIYFALPTLGNPGYLTVLGIFLMSFSAALISSAPGGLGVLELLFVSGLDEMQASDVLAALLVFRLLYLIIPFALSLIVVLAFERANIDRDD